MVFETNDLDGLTADELTMLNGQLHALECAVRRVRLDVIAQIDETELWRGDGARSMGEWLTGQLSVSRTHANDLASVADRVDDQPWLADAFGRGELSWDQYRTACRFATSDTDEKLAGELPALSVRQIRRLAALANMPSTEDAAEIHENRYLRCRWYGSELRINGRLADTDGQLFVDTIDRLAKQRITDQWNDPSTGVLSGCPRANGSAGVDRVETARADALVDLAAGRCAETRAGFVETDRSESNGRSDFHVDATVDVDGEFGRTTPDSRRCDLVTPGTDEQMSRSTEPVPAEMIVHVDATFLADGRGSAEIELGPTLSAETVRRIACDTSIQVHAENETGRPVGVSRKTRRIPSWLARHINHRDNGCRFPGCGQKQWLNHHHIQHWVHGGATNPDNLITLCSHHHRFVHEHRWTIHGHPNTPIEFRGPRGVILTGRPPPLGTSTITSFDKHFKNHIDHPRMPPDH